VKFQATVEASGDGGYTASCSDPQCTTQGLSPASALDALRQEIRYRIEYCPCTGVGDDFVELEVVSAL